MNNHTPHHPVAATVAPMKPLNTSKKKRPTPKIAKVQNPPSVSTRRISVPSRVTIFCLHKLTSSDDPRFSRSNLRTTWYQCLSFPTVTWRRKRSNDTWSHDRRTWNLYRKKHRRRFRPKCLATIPPSTGKNWLRSARLCTHSSQRPNNNSHYYYFYH